MSQSKNVIIEDFVGENGQVIVPHPWRSEGINGIYC